MTNYERIKAMSVEKMAQLIDDIQTDALFLEGTINDLKYSTEWEKWLNSEVEEKAASELIRKQQAEIEELTTEIESLQKQMEWLTGYNQNLMSANTTLSGEIFIAKSEAYKEFAEKAAIALANAYTPEYAYWIDDTLNNLLKELVGEKNERNVY